MRDRVEGDRAGESRAGVPPDAAPSNDERAPFFGSWPLLYALVFLNLVALIALFTWFTRLFE